MSTDFNRSKASFVVKGIILLACLCPYYQWTSLLTSLSHCVQLPVLFSKGMHSPHIASRSIVASFLHFPTPHPPQEGLLTLDFFHANSEVSVTTQFHGIYNPLHGWLGYKHHLIHFELQRTVKVTRKPVLEPTNKNSKAFSLSAQSSAA